jgi:uncharacterized protein
VYMNIDFAPADEEFLEDRVRDGAFPSEADVVKYAIGLIREQYAIKHRELLEALQVGLDDIAAGRVTPYTDDLFEQIKQDASLQSSSKGSNSMGYLAAKTQAELKQLLEELVQNITPIFDQKLKRVILFGSYARGDYDEESDIDVMLLIDDEAKTLQSKYRKPVQRVTSDINWKYDALVCSILQNEQDFYAAVESIIPFYRNVEKEGITVYEQRQPTAIL